MAAVLQVTEVEAEDLQMVEVTVEAQVLKIVVAEKIKMASKDLAEIKGANKIKIKGKDRVDRAIRIRSVNPVMKKVLATNKTQNSPRHLIALYKKTLRQRSVLTLQLFVNSAFILKR